MLNIPGCNKHCLIPARFHLFRFPSAVPRAERPRANDTPPPTREGYASGVAGVSAPSDFWFGGGVYGLPFTFAAPLVPVSVWSSSSSGSSRRCPFSTRSFARLAASLGKSR